MRDTALESIRFLASKRTGTAEHVATSIRHSILNGELEAGDPLREVALAQAAGVSRNTLREALRILSGEGLVRHHPNRGFMVTRLSREDVAEIYFVRGVLETAALERAGDLSAADLEGVRRAVREVESANMEPDLQRWVEADLQFHRELVALSGSERLREMHERLLRELGLLALTFDRIHGRAEDVNEYRDIYETLSNRDRGKAQKLLREHLERGETALLAVAGGPAARRAHEVP